MLKNINSANVLLLPVVGSCMLHHLGTDSIFVVFGPTLNLIVCVARGH